MTKGTREARKMARLQREMQENPEKAMKRQARENRRYQNYQNKYQENKVEEVQLQPSAETREDLIMGRNAVIELLKTDRTVECLYVANGNMEGSIKVIINMAREL